MAQLTLNYYSSTLGMNTKVTCIIPNKRTEDLPVLYLLHGVGGDSTSWSRYTMIEAGVERMSLAVIMPETHSGAYTDTAYGMNYWKYISQELPETIQTFFPQLSTRREKTFVAGQSLGGYGALKLAFATDNYSAAASLSGGVQSADYLEEAFQFAPKEYWEGVFGNLADFKGSANDLFFLAETKYQQKTAFPDIYMACGNEDPFLDANKRAIELLKAYDLDIPLRETDGGHDWTYWAEEIKNVLKWLEKRTQ